MFFPTKKKIQALIEDAVKLLRSPVIQKITVTPPGFVNDDLKKENTQLRNELDDLRAQTHLAFKYMGFDFDKLGKSISR